jgi:hypothetical protein
LFEKVRQIVLDQHDVPSAEVAVEPSPRLGEAGA